MAKKILHLTLKKKWFDLIAQGKKKTEFREVNEYWERRLLNKKIDEIHFRNGYKKNSPFMRVEFKGYSINILEGIYNLNLGKILEIRNWEAPKILL